MSNSVFVAANTDMVLFEHLRRKERFGGQKINQYVVHVEVEDFVHAGLAVSCVDLPPSIACTGPAQLRVWRCA